MPRGKCPCELLDHRGLKCRAWTENHMLAITSPIIDEDPDPRCWKLPEGTQLVTGQQGRLWAMR